MEEFVESKERKSRKEEESTTESESSSAQQSPAPSFVTQVQKPGTTGNKMPLRVSKVEKKDESRDTAQMNSPRRAKQKAQEAPEAAKALLPPQLPEHKGKTYFAYYLLSLTLINEDLHVSPCPTP